MANLVLQTHTHSLSTFSLQYHCRQFNASLLFHWESWYAAEYYTESLSSLEHYISYTQSWWLFFFLRLVHFQSQRTLDTESFYGPWTWTWTSADSNHPRKALRVEASRRFMGNTHTHTHIDKDIKYWDWTVDAGVCSKMSVFQFSYPPHPQIWEWTAVTSCSVPLLPWWEVRDVIHFILITLTGCYIQLPL